MISGSRSPDTTSQVGTVTAMRARDVSRPTEADLDAAELAVTVSYRPPATESSRRGGSSPVAS
jgi:hypothetical protein